MNDKIYTLLNDMDHQTEQYGHFEADFAEVKKWRKSFLSRSAGTGHNWLKYIAAAACAALVITVVAPVRQTVFASVNAFIYSLSELLGIQKDLEPYSTVVGKSITKNNTTVTLNDVILDDNVLLISYTTEAAEDLTDPAVSADYIGYESVYINGRQVSVAASGEIETVDEHHMVSCLEIELEDIDPTKQMDMKISFNVNNEKIGSISFTASGEELLAQTRTTDLNESFTLPDGNELTLSRYTASDVNQKIYFNSTSEYLNYDIKLQGKDDLGNDVEFCVRFFGHGEGRMEVSTIDNGYINENASALTLTLYAAEMPEESGKMSSDYQAVGDSFTIKLN